MFSRLQVPNRPFASKAYPQCRSYHPWFRAPFIAPELPHSSRTRLQMPFLPTDAQEPLWSRLAHRIWPPQCFPTPPQFRRRTLFQPSPSNELQAWVSSCRAHLHRFWSLLQWLGVRMLSLSQIIPDSIGSQQLSQLASHDGEEFRCPRVGPSLQLLS